MKASLINTRSDFFLVKLKKSDYSKALAFANKRMSDIQLYRKRGGIKIDDIIVGALGEIAVYNMLRICGVQSSLPDFDVYDASKKSYNADLLVGNYHLHVKSQCSKQALKFNKSWLMQKNDPILNNEVNNHFFVPTVVDLKTLEVKIYGFFDFEQLKFYNNITYGECEVPHLRDTKLAIYLDNLEIISRLSRWNLLNINDRIY